MQLLAGLVKMYPKLPDTVELLAGLSQHGKPVIRNKVAKGVVFGAADGHVRQPGAVPRKVLQHDVCYVHVE